MISSPLFSVIIEQKLDLATIITAVIAVLAWVFPFPDIGEKDKNNKDNQQEKAPKRNYYLKYRIIVFLICLAVLGVLSYKSNAGTGNPPASTLPPQETEIVSTPEITPEPTPEITPEPTPEITPEPTPEITPEPKNIIQQPQDLEVYPSDIQSCEKLYVAVFKAWSIVEKRNSFYFPQRDDRHSYIYCT